MHLWFRRKSATLLLLLPVIAAGCTLYQSDGRKCIAEGCASFVSASSLKVIAEKQCPLSINSEVAESEDWYPVSYHGPFAVRVYMNLLAPRPELFIVRKGSPNKLDRTCRYHFASQLELEEQYLSKVEQAGQYLNWLDGST